MSVFYCYTHHKKHEASDWRGRPVETKKGIEIQHICLAYGQSHYPEFTTQKIKQERIDYASDMLQSHRGGVLSREFVEVNPTRAKQMLKDGAITKEEVKKSKYVWKEVKGWEKGKKVDANMI